MSGHKRRKRNLRELRRVEQICRSEAERAHLDLERNGLMNIAEDCKRAAEELERAVEMSTMMGPIIWTFGLLALLLFVALYLPW